MVGITGALIGTAVLGAGASALGASKSSKAISQSADAGLQGQREAIAAQERMHAESLAAQKDAYDRSLALQQQAQKTATGALSPYSALGLPAGRQINALLGLDGSGPQNAAFDKFRDSSGYQFRLGQGVDAVNSGYAARGALQSGAAQKALTEYGQNFASGELGNYMAYLGNQQGMGLSAASALGGVSTNNANTITGLNTNYANALTGLNMNLGNAYSQTAQNMGQITGNAALAHGQNYNNMISGIGGALGQGLGALAFSSYGRTPTNLLMGTPYG